MPEAPLPLSLFPEGLAAASFEEGLAPPAWFCFKKLILQIQIVIKKYICYRLFHKDGFCFIYIILNKYVSRYQLSEKSFQGKGTST